MFTPGPWHVDFDTITTVNMGNIATVHQSVDNKLASNARLIASAPALLEACQEAHNYFLVLAEITQPVGMPEMVKILAEAIRKARESRQ